MNRIHQWSSSSELALWSNHQKELQMQAALDEKRLLHRHRAKEHLSIVEPSNAYNTKPNSRHKN